MTMKRIGVAIAVVLMLSALGYFYQLRWRTGSPEQTQQQIEKLLQQRAEQTFQNQSYQAQIAVYQRLLEKYPDNPEIKKKLEETQALLQKNK